MSPAVRGSNVPRRWLGLARSVAPVGLALVLATPRAPGAPQAHADQIFLHEGLPVTGVQITAESFETVEYEGQNKKKESVPAENVKEIVYGDAPPSFEQALNALRDGDYENAIRSLELAATQGKGSWIGEYTTFYLAEAHRLWAHADPKKAAEATKRYSEFLKKHERSRFRPSALRGLAQALGMQEKYDEATREFDRLENEAVTKRFGIYWQASARYEKAKTQLSAGDFTQARSGFGRVKNLIDSEGDKIKKLPRVLRAQVNDFRLMAILLEGEALIRQERYAEARNYFEKLVGSSTNGAPTEEIRIVAGAQNGIAECFFMEGNYKEAWLRFARTTALYFGAEEEEAKALYYSGRCVQELRPEKWQSLAGAYFNEVVNRYPTTVWAGLARKEIR